MKRKILILTMAGLLVSSGGLVFSVEAQERSGWRHGGAFEGPRGEGERGRFQGMRQMRRGPAGPMAFLRGLDLTEGQREEIRSLMQAERELNRPLQEELRENRRLLREARTDGHFDEIRVRELARRQGEILAELIVSRERVQVRMLSILTPEQQERLESMRERMQQRRGGFHRGPRSRSE